jgi:hypothetical protein
MIRFVVFSVVWFCLLAGLIFVGYSIGGLAIIGASALSVILR